LARAKSHIIAQASGAVAGVVYGSSIDHPITLRTNFKKRKGNSLIQVMQRQSMTSAIFYWLTLTDESKERWNKYAEITGFAKTGRNAWISCGGFTRYVFLRGGFPTISYNGPDIMEIPKIEVRPPTSIANGIRIIVHNRDLFNGIKLVSHKMGPFSKARRKFSGPFTGEYIKFDTIPANTYVTIDYTGLVTGGIYFIKFQGVVSQSGKANRRTRTTIVRGVAG
jgi:hypothetical protein